MKRALKITAISLSSIIAILAIAIIIVCNIVFSPKTLTPIVRNNIGRFITCQADLDTAELTFFSTFPNFALNLSNVRVINPIADAQSDTLAHVGRLSASVNVSQFLFHGNLVINQVHLDNTVANIFCDSLGNANYNIIALSSTEEEEDTTSSSLFDLLQVNDVVINNLSATYIDQKSSINASINGLNTTLSAQLQGANGNINAHIFLPCLRGGAKRAEGSNFQLSTLNSQLSINGSLKDNHFDGNLALNLPSTTFDLDSNRLADSLALRANVPAELNLDVMHINLKDALLAVNSHEINLNGVAQLDNDDINLDIQFATNQWNLEELIALIPEAYTDLLDGINVSGNASLSGSARGTYNDSIMPLISANLNYTDGRVQYSELPLPINNINLSLSANADLNPNGKIECNISNSQLSILNSQLSIPNSSFLIPNSSFTDALCDINLSANLNLPELKPLLPEDLNVDMNGRANADISARFNLDDATNLRLDRIIADASIKYTNLDVLYNDSIAIKDPKGTLNLTLPSPHTNKHFKELAQATLKSSNLQANIKMSDSNNSSPELGEVAKPEGSVIAQFSILNSQLTLGIGDILDTTQFYTAVCQFDFDHIQGSMDTINFDITQPEGTLEVYPMRSNKKNPTFTIAYANQAIKANMGSFLNINTQNLKIEAKTDYNKEKENLLDQLNPTIKFDFNNGLVAVDGFDADINIPAIKFQFRPNNFDIEQSRIIIDDSDFALSGNITNLKNFSKGRGLLRGNLRFESEKTDIDQLMNLVNGLGADTETTDEIVITDDNTDFALADAHQTTQNQIDTQYIASPQAEPNPFMVPKKVNITLDTHIKKAIFGNTDIENLGGRLTIKDGEAILEQMGFTTDAAEMQLTGIYRSERRNHLFAGLDFHLLNIDIAKLIDLVPAVDTIVPMLSSFAGRAQFHIAAETYLRADYSPKMSTLRAAAALEGKDLVLLDSETFSTIAKYMMFNKKTENIVDSISVEMTVFRNEVDLYPFLISMDKWQAVLSGRHNLDNSFNYHISLTDCPLPARLGLDIKGTFDDLKFALVPCKYKALYKPEKQGATEKQTLALKKIISFQLKFQCLAL